MAFSGCRRALGPDPANNCNQSDAPRIPRDTPVVGDHGRGIMPTMAVTSKPAAQPCGFPDEASLLARLRAGDDEAFAELVKATIDRMLATARRMLHSDEEAQDAVQEAYLSAFKSLDRFTGDSRLATWLHRITVNAALMRLRSRKARPMAALDDLLPRYKDDGHRFEPVAAWTPVSGEDLERDEIRRNVRAKIDELPDDYRTVLILRDIEGLDTNAAGVALGITPGAVKTRLHRARQALRTLLEQEFVG